MLKIKKIMNKELEGVSAQCCCQIKNKSAMYEKNSCCKTDCKTKGKPAQYHTWYH